ncbi:unnamed protein product [Mytilus coruscus]|uniref:Reverse transcriptase domain-containing protein n=1 Tax=Mytilus coruscus TaxID=42192 RepID=A0A6J8DZR6_MYTCO|nr:unnamed protein product [Mytilus coruscus]
MSDKNEKRFAQFPIEKSAWSSEKEKELLSLREQNKSHEDYVSTLLKAKREKEEETVFGVVQHTISHDKLLDRRIHPDIWLLIKNFYNGRTSKVNILQGVRQGCILSTHIYKIFEEDLPKELEENSLGFILGTIYCRAPACADGLALQSSNPDELQVMLNIIQR